MTSRELYYEFQLILNKNATNANINQEVGNFVWLFNRESRKWLNDFVQKSSATSLALNIQELLEINPKLDIAVEEEGYVMYHLPSNYCHFVSSSSRGKREECELLIENFVKRPKALNTELIDLYSSQSFDFEESLCNIVGKKLQVFKRDYNIIDTYLSYYKLVDKIDIEGTQNADGSYSKDVDIDLSDTLAHEIIDRVVLEVLREFENTGAYQLGESRKSANS